MKKLTIGVIATALVATGAVASNLGPRSLGVEASIPFADTIGIRNFQADDDDMLMIEDNHRNWYRAELLGPCTGLRFAEHIGFETRGTSSFDKFSSIRVEGRDCPVISLVTAAKPLTSKQKKAQAEADKAHNTH